MENIHGKIKRNSASRWFSSSKLLLCPGDFNRWLYVSETSLLNSRRLVSLAWRSLCWLERDSRLLSTTPMTVVGYTDTYCLICVFVARSIPLYSVYKLVYKCVRAALGAPWSSFCLALQSSRILEEGHSSLMISSNFVAMFRVCSNPTRGKPDKLVLLYVLASCCDWTDWTDCCF